MQEHTQRYAVSEYSNGHPTAQETNLFRHFANLALSGTIDPHWGDIALKTQIVLDACLQSARNSGASVPVTSE